MFIPPWIAQAPLALRDRPETPVDTHFLRFPVIAERLAFERLRQMRA